MKVKTSLSLLALASLAGGAAFVAHAESTYGYSGPGTGTVTATAKVNVSIYVPKVVLLRVGSAGATVDTLGFQAELSIPATPSNTTVTGSSTGTAASAAIAWTGAAPGAQTVAVNTKTAQAFAWTNASGVTVTCSAGAMSGGGSGPTVANISAAKGGADNFNHPTTLGLDTCAPSPALTAGTLYQATWTYTLDTALASAWAPGTYTTQVTYTATGT